MAGITLAFEHLNLRWNPFGEPAPEDAARLAVVEVDQYVERLRRPGFALQYLGEAGRGKSTHLHALHEHFPEAPFVKFPEGVSPPSVPRAPLLFLDETQRMPPTMRRRVFTSKSSYVIGTHEDHTMEFTRAGLEYVSICLRGLTPERLAQIIERRIGWARRGPGLLPTVSQEEIEGLIATHEDDLSAILGQLYEEFQTREGGSADEHPGEL